MRLLPNCRVWPLYACRACRGTPRLCDACDPTLDYAAEETLWASFACALRNPPEIA